MWDDGFLPLDKCGTVEIALRILGRTLSRILRMKIDEREMISASEAARNPSQLFRAAAEGGRFVIITNNTPTAAVVSMEQYRELAELEERREDLKLLALALVRVATDRGRRHNLDDVIAEFGYTDAEIDAADDSED
jgi:prevent-host-death family protein